MGVFRKSSSRHWRYNSLGVFFFFSCTIQYISLSNQPTIESTISNSNPTLLWNATIVSFEWHSQITNANAPMKWWVVSNSKPYQTKTLSKYPWPIQQSAQINSQTLKPSANNASNNSRLTTLVSGVCPSADNQGPLLITTNSTQKLPNLRRTLVWTPPLCPC